jgi:hypothetical protein
MEGRGTSILHHNTYLAFYPSIRQYNTNCNCVLWLQAARKEQEQQEAIQKAKEERDRILAERTRLAQEEEDARKRELARKAELEEIDRQAKLIEAQRRVCLLLC